MAMMFNQEPPEESMVDMNPVNDVHQRVLADTCLSEDAGQYLEYKEDEPDQQILISEEALEVSGC